MACLYCDVSRLGAIIETTKEGLCTHCGRDVMKKVPAPNPLLKAAEIIEKKRESILKEYTHLDDKNIGIEVLNIVAKALRGEE